ncbi:ATP synthase F0 subunit C [bacterium]|nr:ATP synthase F0 subunit C [bacterium]
MKKLALLTTALLPSAAFAEEAVATMTTSGSEGTIALAKALCIALPAAIVGYSQSRAASAALDGIGRNPASGKPLFTPLLLSLALMESLVLFAFAIAFMI